MSAWEKEQRATAVLVPEEEVLQDFASPLDHEPEEKEASDEKGLNTVKEYLQEIRKTPLLTFEQEQELAKRIAAGDQEARTRMIEANLRLVVAIGKHYINRGLAFSDIIEEGNLGLMRAVEKFEYQRGFKFSTYASWWIKQAIARAIATQSRLIRMPVHVAEMAGVYNRTVRRLTQKFGREPYAAEIARAMRISVDRARLLGQLGRETLSLDMLISDDGEDTWKDVLRDEQAASPLEAHDDSRRQERISAWLTGLSDMERRVIEMRYGLNDKSPLTLDSIGKKFGITRERVRQIEKQAIQRLRNITQGLQVEASDML